MQFTTVAVTLVTALAGFATADSCNKDGVYCGYSLIAKGKYTLRPTE